MKRKKSDREMLWSFMPHGLRDFFEIVNVERSDKSIDVWLDERREKSAEDKYNADIVGYGYTSYCVIQDHLMRGVPMFLHLRKCRWLDKKTGVTFTYDIDYGEEKGTRLSAELVSFLKSEGGDGVLTDQDHC